MNPWIICCAWLFIAAVTYFCGYLHGRYNERRKMTNITDGPLLWRKNK